MNHEYIDDQSIQNILKYSARNEVASFALDWILQNSIQFSEYKAKQAWKILCRPSYVRLTDRVGVTTDKQETVINPNSEISGISPNASPDLLLSQFKAIGDIKTGRALRHSHLLTCTGYALARESQLGAAGNTNIGVIFFVETQSFLPTTARSYFFVISDSLRREFIDKRDRVFNMLSNEVEPDVNEVTRETYCVHCKYVTLCDGDRR